MFIPATREEARALGWDSFDVILVTGDAYIDTPSSGAAVIGHVLIDAGYRVGIIAQPDMTGSADITRLGEPLLFWGVTAGAMDSMVANYTASGKRRKRDDLTPGGINNRRPDRTVIAYTNCIKRYCKGTAPIVLGGVEAGMRRVTHYDFWSNKLRRSVLLDSKADYLIYGMAEKSIVELAGRLSRKEDISRIPSLCYISRDRPRGYHELPSHEQAVSDPLIFEKFFLEFYRRSVWPAVQGMTQKYAERCLVLNPPAPPLTPTELDRVYEMPYERKVHPLCAEKGEVRGLGTVRFSITAHRGCFGGCSFCAIAIHQGRVVVSRTEGSILREAAGFTRDPDFRGTISDVGGPSANMYGMGCAVHKGSACADRECVYPALCGNLGKSHRRYRDLLRKLRKLPDVKKVFVASGVRYDLAEGDAEYGEAFCEELLRHHVSGQLKLAPEHSAEHVLELMRKPRIDFLNRFKKRFDRINKNIGKRQYLTYYFIAAHPGSTMSDMRGLNEYIEKHLHIRPEQVQIFTPTPSTLSTLMYYTGRNPCTGEKIFVERDVRMKEKQKKIITG